MSQAHEAFADTSFFIALVNPRDADHATAVQLAKRDSLSIITTEFVLVETGNFLCRSGDRSVFSALMTSIPRGGRTRVLPSSSEVFAG